MFGQQRYLLPFLPTLGLSAQLLYVSHYSGTINTVTFTGSSSSGTLALTTSLRGCGNQPSFISWDSASRTLVCSDETGYGTSSISTFSANADGVLSAGPKISAPPGSIANAFYGGPNNNGFVAVAH
jgi:6-phosphogluconolactonase (cycloisomerase 2 family)